MICKAGQRLASAACTTQAILVRCPAEDIDVRCGGAPMVDVGNTSAASVSLDHRFATGSAIGKRYESSDGSVEMLCTRPGDGALSIGDEALVLKEPKSLPASD